jgi:hypothetical protein
MTHENCTADPVTNQADGFGFFVRSNERKKECAKFSAHMIAGFCRAYRPQTLLSETSGTRGSVALLLVLFVCG